MSLNGLDDPKVVEVYEAAIAEPGGWFLLKYESRDEIQVLSRGNGGIVEMRNAIAEYDETSPLYGFLKYRRRSVIIKYLPEDCSRIIQARAAVHFNAVSERFSPYDTTFEITIAADLKDSKLSAACSLHTASCSTSSSTSSLRRRRLVEITEEEEEEQRATKRQSVQGADGGRPESPAGRPPTSEPVTLNSELASSPDNSKFSAPTTSEVPQFVGVDERPTSPENDVYTYGSYPYSKPKVKLGPRPSVDANGRPQTAGNFRPVSAIPAGFKMFGKGGKKGKNRDRQNSASSHHEDLGSTDFSVADNSAFDDSQERPVTSSGLSIDSLPLPGSTPKKPTISREKARLMKAKQLRDQKKKMSLLPSSEATPAEREEPRNAVDETTPGQDEATSCSDPPLERDRRRLSLSKDDSGIILETTNSIVPNDQNSDLAPSDSHPPSPLVGSSDAGHSTKASSISESTDETVYAKEEARSPENKTVQTQAPVGGDLEGATYIIDGPADDESKSHVEVAVDEKTAQEEPSDVVQNLERGSDDGVSSIAEASRDPENLSAQDVDESLDKHISLENNALPLPGFSANGTRILEENRQTLTESSTHQLDPESRFSGPAISPGKGNASPTLPSNILASDFLVAEKTASQRTIVPPVPAESESSLTLDSESDYTMEVEKKADDNGEVQLTRKEKQARRETRVLPIQTTNLKMEQNFEDEMQNTIVEEATSVTLIKAPLSPVPPQSPNKTQDGHAIRTVSNPVRSNLVLPSDLSQSSARSTSSSAAYLHHVAQKQQGGNLAKKSNISSNISARIKELEQRSASSGDAPAAPVRERPSSMFFAVTKREPSRSQSVMDRANSFRNRTPPSPERTLESSPEAAVRRNRLERSGSVTSRLSMFESAPGSRNLAVPTAGPGRGRPESISVTARIIRDPNQPAQMGFEPSRDPSEYNPLELKQSPLLVDHQAASQEAEYPTTEPAAEHTAENPEHEKSGKPRQLSLSIVKGFRKDRRKSVTSDGSNPAYSPTRPDTMHANASFSPRLSISSHRSSFSKDRDMVLSPAESGSGDDAKSNNGDKKLSRASRLMNRLSQLSVSRSKNNPSTISTSTTKEETREPVQSRPSTTGSPTIVSYMGDVNVQFPDNLLWKRRNMCLDSQGHLILSALPAQNGRPAQGTKRYHLNDFCAPYTPDVEVQELPNSVILDFIEGSGIQVACEDRAGQLRVLQTLQEAHATTRGTTYAL